MEKIKIDEDKKRKIYKHIQSSIGYYKEYEDKMEMLNVNGILDKEFLTRILENLVYNCIQTKLQLKIDEEFEKQIEDINEVFNGISKSSNYHENEYIRDNYVKEYEDMSIEEIYTNVKKCLEIEEIYNKVRFTQNVKERGYATIKSITSIDGHEIDLSKEERKKLEILHKELKQLTTQNKTDVKSMQDMIQTYNKVASKIWINYLSNETEQPRWLVHNLSRGGFDGEFDKKYMSTSLVTSKTMGLFRENMENNFGFIIKPKNIISASEHDSFTNNSPINEYMETFSYGNVPPIKLPWEIEEECIKETIDNSGEMLNYDNETVYSEIVVDEFDIEAMYYRSNGENELAPNYEIARKMAEERGVELKELDISKAREKQGLEAMTQGMQKKFLYNILRKNFISEEQIKKCMNDRRINVSEIEEQFIEKYYKEFYQRYLQLRNDDRFTKEDIMQEFNNMVPDKEIKEMNNFYNQRQEDVFQDKSYADKDNGVKEIEIEKVSSQREETYLWTNRFKEWYGEIDKVPESMRPKFINMKSDIIRSIRNIFKDRNNSKQENTQNQDIIER